MGAKFRELGSFARVHFACYGFSCYNILSYGVHWLIHSERIAARSAVGGILELVCVSVRFYNEYWHDRLATSDVLHHLVLYTGTALCFLHEPCAQFTYLLTHMNIAHVPMLLWYGAARRSNYLSSVSTPGSSTEKWQKGARAIFPAVYILSSVYRFVGIVQAASTEYLKHSQISVTFVLLLALGLPLAALDYQWFKLFKGELRVK